MINKIDIDMGVTMPIIALKGFTVLPEMNIHFDISRETSLNAANFSLNNNQSVFLVGQIDQSLELPTLLEDLYSIGTVCVIKQIMKFSGEPTRVLVQGKYKAQLVDMDLNPSENYLTGTVIECQDREIALCPDQEQALLRSLKSSFENYFRFFPKLPKDIVVNVVVNQSLSYVVNHIAQNVLIPPDKKQQFLEKDNIIDACEFLVETLNSEINILKLQAEFEEKARSKVDQDQRNYFLTHLMRMVQSELGQTEDPDEEIDDYYYKLYNLKLDSKYKDKLSKEINKLSKMPMISQEAAIIRNYLDLCLELPWKKKTSDKISIDSAFKILEQDHYGLSKVKQRILEFLACKKLKATAGGQILCLVGPPGVGKTSIAKSIARCMGRKYSRISLGGVHDEADIRGHRKTYVGAMPGRIITGINLSGSSNPVLVLDEIDKMSSDFRGDPQSAMLEVLDSEQNHEFRDHFMEMPFDLSDVLFVATANDTSNISRPLLDRMEIIDLSSYTDEEKLQIAKKYLIKKQVQKYGIKKSNLSLSDQAIRYIISHYTKESGVRKLEQCIGALCRKTAKEIVEHGVKKVIVSPENMEEFLGSTKYKDDNVLKTDEIGVVNGLAWTSVGGEMLQAEVNIVDGTGKIQITGNLGKVMEESAKAAITYTRSRATELGIDSAFYKEKDIHIHFPEAAVPKDGPSAGVTVSTAIISALTGRPVRHNVAMTGEVTLRGRVLPIGGLKEKTMAAYKNGIDTVIVPKANESDLKEIDKTVYESLNFVFADSMDCVLDTALISMLKKSRVNSKLHAIIKDPSEKAVGSQHLGQ